MVRSEETVRWVEGQEAKAERAVKLEAIVHPAPIPLYPSYRFLAATQAQAPMDALRQDGILGTLFLVTCCIFALLVSSEGLCSKTTAAK